MKQTRQVKRKNRFGYKLVSWLTVFVVMAVLCLPSLPAQADTRTEDEQTETEADSEAVQDDLSDTDEDPTAQTMVYTDSDPEGETLARLATNPSWLRHLPLDEDFPRNITLIARTCRIRQDRGVDPVLPENESLYGIWYGEPEAAWNTLFVSWVIKHAHADYLPQKESSAVDLAYGFSEDGRYIPAQNALPYPGYIAFLYPEDLEEKTGDSVLEDVSRTAIVSKVDLEKFEVTLLEGDVEGEIVERTLPFDDEQLAAYGMTEEESPLDNANTGIQDILNGSLGSTVLQDFVSRGEELENLLAESMDRILEELAGEAEAEEEAIEDEEEPTGEVSTITEEEPAETEPEESEPEEAEPETTETVEPEETEPSESVDEKEQNTDNNDLRKWITSVHFKEFWNGVNAEYDPNKDLYKVDMELKFTFPKDSVDMDNLTYTYPLPNYVMPEDLLGKEYILTDKYEYAGTYKYVKDPDTNGYKLEITYDQAYMKNAAGEIETTIKFDGSIGAGAINGEGDLVLPMPGVENNVVISGSNIHYPPYTNGQQDIHTQKNGLYDTNTNKLIYEVYVYSYKGSPEIDFTDQLDLKGLPLKNPEQAPNVTVKPVVLDQWNGSSHPNFWYPEVEDNGLKVNVDYNYNGGKPILNLKLPGLEKEEEANSHKRVHGYVVRYEYDLADLSDGVNIQLNNTVKVESKVNDKVITDSSSSGPTVYQPVIDKSHRVVKNGQFINGEIRWTVMINPNKVELAGSTYTDSMFGELRPDQIEISPREGYEIKTGQDGKVESITFKELKNGENKETYFLTYSTPAKTGWQDQIVKNDYNFKPGESGKPEINDSASAVVPGCRVEKSAGTATVAPDGLTATIPWTILFQVPDTLPEKLLIIDEFPNQYLTGVEIASWQGMIFTDWSGNSKGSISRDDYTATFKELGGEEKIYTAEQIRNNPDLKKKKYTSMEIVLNKEVKKPKGAGFIQFTFNTTADLSVADKQDVVVYRNTITIGDKKAEASWTYSKSRLTKMDGNYQTAETIVTGDTVRWRIQAHLGTGEKTKKLTITDTLPPGLRLESLNFNYNQLSWQTQDGVLSNEEKSNWNFKVTADCTKPSDQNGGVLKVQIEPGQKDAQLHGPSEYQLEIVCRINQSILDEKKDYVFKNSASMSYEKKEVTSNTQQQTWKPSSKPDDSKPENTDLEKEGRYDPNLQRVDFTCTINRNKKEVSDLAENVEILDSLSFDRDDNAGHIEIIGREYTLIPNSVHLYIGDKLEKKDGVITNQEIPLDEWSWSLHTVESAYHWNDKLIRVTHTIKGKVPAKYVNKQTLIMTYAYSVYFKNHLWQDGTTVPELKIKNTVEVTGLGKKEFGALDGAKWVKSDHTGSVSSEKYLSLVKVDSDNYTIQLGGAHFAVYYYDSAEKKYVHELDLATTSNGSNKGTLDITHGSTNGLGRFPYKYNTLYYIVETQSPDGYLVPMNPTKYFFWFSQKDSSGNITPPAGPQEDVDKAIDLSSRSHTVLIPNEKAPTTDLTLEKSWVNQNGQPITPPVGSVNVMLSQLAKVYPGRSALEVQIKKAFFDPTKPEWLVNREWNNMYSHSEVRLILRNDQHWTPNSAFIPPSLTLNGKPITNVKSVNIKVKPDNPNDSQYCQYATYTFTVDPGQNTVLGGIDSALTGYYGWQFDSLEITPPTPEAVKEIKALGPYAITAADNWKLHLTDLPTTGGERMDDGTYRYYEYVYKVKEIDLNGWDVTYTNNDGINEGTIGITNKRFGVDLPFTGQGGIQKPLAFGLLLVFLGGAGIYLSRKRTLEETS